MPLTSLLLSCLVTLAPSDAGPPRGPVFINERAVPIPVNCERPELVQKVDLYVSADQGKQWHLYAAIQPTQKEISFVAPTDGEYWFDLVTTFKDGRSEPRAPGLQPPLLVLIVDTKPPRITLRPQDSSDGQASVAWEIEDDHLDLRSLKLEYRDATTGSWVSLPVIPPSAKGEKRWPVHGTGSVLVRLSVSDLAENQAQAQVEIPLGKGSGQFAVAGGQPGGQLPVGGQGTVAASAAPSPATGLQAPTWPSSHGQNLPAAGSTAVANTRVRELSARRKIPRPWFHRRRHHLAQLPPRRMLQIQAHPRFRRRLPPNMPAAKAMGRRALVRHFLLRQEPLHLPKHRLCRLRQRLCRRKPLLRESLLAQTVAVCPHNWPAGTSTAQAGLTRISVADSTCRHRVI
jgi:hypothetical protein